MIKLYEDACKADKLTSEQTKAIRQVFDADKKHWSYRKEQAEKYSFETVLLSSLEDPEEGTYREIEDPKANVEDIVLQRDRMSRLYIFLGRISIWDREFILDRFSHGTGYIEYLMEKYDMTKRAVECAEERIIAELRHEFEKEHYETGNMKKNR